MIIIEGKHTINTVDFKRLMFICVNENKFKQYFPNKIITSSSNELFTLFAHFRFDSKIIHLFKC